MGVGWGVCGGWMRGGGHKRGVGKRNLAGRSSTQAHAMHSTSARLPGDSGQAQTVLHLIVSSCWGGARTLRQPGLEMHGQQMRQRPLQRLARRQAAALGHRRVCACQLQG